MQYSDVYIGTIPDCVHVIVNQDISTIRSSVCNVIKKIFQKNQITTEMPTPSTLENYLHMKVIGASLYEIYFLKEFMYSAEMTKIFSKAISEKK